jgi:diacylglycerol O-acyltransferase / wax synthase
MHERLSPVEAIMWRAGQDPSLRMIVGNLIILDHGPSPEELQSRLATAAEEFHQLRCRPDDLSGAKSRPAWIEVPEVDPGAHLATMAVSAPGGRRQLLDLLALLEPRPFDPERPPWDATLIEGLEDGRVALYLRAHHALTDGPGGLELIKALLDREEPSAVAVADRADVETAPPAEEADADVEATDTGSGNLVAAVRRPGTVTLTIDLTRAAGAAREAAVAAMDAAGVARDAAGAAREVRPGQSAVRALQRGLEAVSSVSRQMLVVGGPMSPLSSSRSVANHFEVISIPGARTAALALGGSRNDLLVAATAAALGAYHAHLGLATPELRMAMPAARRRDSHPGGNWFAPTRVVVPTDGGHPGPFFGVVAERLDRARHEPAVPLTSTLASAVSLLPSRALRGALHSQARSVDFVATCFPGLRRPQTICGATVEESYPFGPRLGCLMNITAFGNGDRLDVGVTLDPASVTEPDVLLGCLIAAFESLAPGPTRSTRTRATRA